MIPTGTATVQASSTALRDAMGVKTISEVARVMNRRLMLQFDAEKEDRLGGSDSGSVRSSGTHRTGKTQSSKRGKSKGEDATALRHAASFSIKKSSMQ